MPHNDYDDDLDDDFLDDELLMRRRWLSAPAEEDADADGDDDDDQFPDMGDDGESEDDELRNFIENLDGAPAEPADPPETAGPVPLFRGDRAGR
jgi:hypothetical protein